MSDPNSTEALRAAFNSRDIARSKPFLVLGWVRSNGRVAGGRYPIADEMAPALREIARTAKARVSNAQMSEYDGPTVLDPEEGVYVPASRLRVDSPFVEFLTTIDDFDPLTAEQVRKKKFSFYAIGFGADDRRMFFVRQKASQISGTTKIFGFIEAALRPVESPILSLEKSIDFILMDEGAIVFGSQAFEKFIMEPSELANYFDSSMDAVSARIAFEPSVLAAVKSKGRDSMLVRGRVRSIMARPYFSNLTIDRVREKIVSKGLDADRFIFEDKLRFDAKDTMFVLKLLDQKVWNGDFDGVLYSTSAAVPERP